MRTRGHWRRHVASLDPQRHHHEIYRTLVTLEFPWDMNQALSFALFRTFAVPSIGRLLHETGEFEARPQKRYDDTALLLDEVLRHGMHTPEGRAAIRRVNQMHASYDIANDDMRYVLSTLVVVPKRWLDDYGWRSMSRTEVQASTRYYVELGRLLGIKDLPTTYSGFERLMDSYEAERFGFDTGGRQVADATLALMASFYPSWAPMRTFSRALMDEPLLAALGYPAPPRAVVRAARTGLRLRGLLLRLAPSRERPVHVRDLPRTRSYPAGFEVEAMGTFPGHRPVDPAH
jgi:ER-bound oxygenase mpaB/B'/Rubber oxygenase, catalytic domain